MSEIDGAVAELLRPQTPVCSVRHPVPTMDLDVHVAAATFSDGSEVEFSGSTVIFVVGANNSGKSRALAELPALLAHSAGGVVLKAVRRGGGATGEAIIQWLEGVAYVTHDPTGTATMFSVPPLGTVHQHEIQSIRSLTADGPLMQAVQLLTQTLGASDRLGLASQQGSFDRVQGQPSTALQALQADPQLEEDLSRAAVTAFGQPVTLNRVAGPNLRLHVGRPQRPPSLMDVDYAKELAALPTVDEQGDGYKAFIGVMLSVLSARSRILLVDEPEAFLHPPQARRLGREIASRTQHGTQVFCATHSADVLEGALHSGSDVSVLRITRDGAVNRPCMLDTETLRKLWADPLLRYSGALDALFARGLVICENERDCTFYLAVLDEDPDAPSDHDLEFVTVGGKTAIPRVAAAIHPLGVPVSAICDIDVLNDAALLGRLVESLGSTIDNEMQRDLRVLHSAVENLAPAESVVDLQQLMTAALDANEGSVVSRDTWKTLQAAVRRPTGWKRLKQDGLSPLRGQQRQAADRLIAALRDRRLYVVHSGELEGWVPDAGGKGSDWLSRAFAADGHRRPEVRVFVRQLAAI